MVLLTALAVITVAFMAYEFTDSYVVASTGKSIANHITGTESETQQLVNSNNDFEAALEIFVDRLEDFVEQFTEGIASIYNAIYDAALAIMQYMDAWGTVIVVLFAVVIVILLAMFFNVAKLRRSR